MPGEKKKYLGLFVLIGVSGLLLIFLNSFLHNNYFPFLRREKTINFPEENKKEEEINNQEKINNFPFLDSTMINIIIFLLIFLIAFLFVYLHPLSPVVNNNERDTIFDQEKNNINESPFRRKVLFQGTRYLEEENRYFFYDKSEGELAPLIAVADKTPDNPYKYKFGGDFHYNEYQGNITECFQKIKIEAGIDEISEKIKYFQENIYDRKKNFFFGDFFNIDRDRLREYDLNNLNDDKKYLKKLCGNNNFSLQMLRECFKGKVDFFHQSNIIAALLSYLFFLFFFVILYFVFYFLYALFYFFFFFNEEEIEEENKFLIAFYKALKAIIFFNIRGFSKIIPFLLFLIVLFYDGYLFFSSSISLIPIFYDISNLKMIRIMSIHKLEDYVLKQFLTLKEEKELLFFVDDRHKETYFALPEKPLEK